MNKKKGRWKKYRALIFNCVNKESGIHLGTFAMTVTAKNETDAEEKIHKKLDNEWKYDIGKVEEDI